MPDQLTVVAAGLMDYARCWELQQRLHAQVVAGEAPGYVILVEHPPVLTFGKHADKKHLLFAPQFFAAKGVQLVDTDRGGEVTAHEPGQLVVYPILRLADFGLAPKKYVALLEDAVIRTLAGYGITAATDAENPGVWVGRDKVCAVGVRIKDRATLHGIALNVANDLALFQQIVPCGIQGRGVTSLARLLGRPVTVDEVAPRLTDELARGLGTPLALGAASPL